MLRERGGERSLARARAKMMREAAEEATVARPGALELVRPGVRRFVAKRVLALGGREMRRDRDAVRFAVNDFPARQLPIREADLRVAKSEPRRQAVVQELKMDSLVLRLNREERDHAIRLTCRRNKTMAKKSVVVLAFLAIAAVCPAADPAGKMITFPSGTETPSAYLALPEGAGRKPAIIVIQEWWGLNDFVKGKADDFAKKGYVAFAPDLYRGKVTADPDVAHQLMRGMPEDRAIRDLKAAFDYLRSRDDVDTTRIASVGWCMGGGYSLALAFEEPKLAGTVIYYGRLVTDDARIKTLAVPLLGNFGGKDEGIPPETVRDFEGKAKAAGKAVDFKIYRDAGHGFASAKDPAVFRAADAKDADARTDAFFARVLKKK
jgi:carboxymethylenebutenolidase